MIAPVVVSDNTAAVGAVIDRLGSRASLRDRDRHARRRGRDPRCCSRRATSGSGFAAVADADLIGTEAEAGFTFFADDGETRKLGYIGNKRYTRSSPRAATPGVPGADRRHGDPRHATAAQA